MGRPIVMSNRTASHKPPTMLDDPAEETEYVSLSPARPRTMSTLALAATALVSGLANGYNGTVLEGAIPRLRDAGVIYSSWQSGLLGGALSLGGLSGSLACTELAYRLARRNLVIFGEMIIIGSTLAFSFAPNFDIILAARTLTGIGVGICGLAKPLIVSEQSPPQMRGLLVALFAVGQSIGMNAFYVTDLLMPPSSARWAWRVLVGLGATPAVAVVLLAKLAAPQGGYWDVPPSALREGAAAPTSLEASSTKRRDAPEADEPLKQLATLLTREPFELKRNFLLILALQIGYNLSGTLIISNYASDIFAVAGASDRSLPIVVGIVQFAGLLSAAVFTDRLGRRPLLLWSCGLTVVCLYAIASLIGFQDALAPTLGGAFTPALLALMVAVEYAVGVGLNPIRIVLSAELMPNRYRSLGMALGNAAGWGFGLFQLFFFPVLSSLLGGPAPQFAFFATIVSALTIVLVLFLPETKGISFGGEE